MSDNSNDPTCIIRSLGDRQIDSSNAHDAVNYVCACNTYVGVLQQVRARTVPMHSLCFFFIVFAAANVPKCILCTNNASIDSRTLRAHKYYDATEISVGTCF